MTPGYVLRKLSWMDDGRRNIAAELVTRSVQLLNLGHLRMIGSYVHGDYFDGRLKLNFRSSLRPHEQCSLVVHWRLSRLLIYHFPTGYFPTTCAIDAIQKNDVCIGPLFVADREKLRSFKDALSHAERLCLLDDLAQLGSSQIS